MGASMWVEAEVGVVDAEAHGLIKKFEGPVALVTLISLGDGPGVAHGIARFSVALGVRVP
jgi:hypothetical protein